MLNRCLVTFLATVLWALPPISLSADRSQVEQLLEESRGVDSSDARLALQLALEALEVARTSGSQELLAEVLLRLGVSQFRLGEYEPALLAYSDSLRIAGQIGNREAMSKALNNIGVLYYYWGNLDEAIDHYREALELLLPAGEPDALGRAYNNLGAVANAAGRYAEALDYFEEALGHYKSAADTSAIASTHNNVGLALLGLEQFESALQRFELALQISMEIDSIDEQAISQHHRAQVMLEMGQADNARAAAAIGLRLKEAIGDPAGASMIRLTLGRIELAAGAPGLAVGQIETALAGARALNIRELARDALEVLAEAQQRAGNPESALKSLRESHRIYTYLLSERSAMKLAEARARFELASKEAEIDRLESLRSKQRQAAISLLLAIVLLISTIILLAARVRQRALNQRAMEAKNRELMAASAERERLSRIELAHLGRFVSLGELTATVAHELNQPLASISTNAQLVRRLLDGAPTGRDVHEAIDDIALGARGAWQLLHHLRRLARRGKVEHAVHDLRRIIDVVMELAGAEARKQRIRIEVSAPQRPALVEGDRIHLQQILMNLLSNAMAAVAECPETRFREVRLEIAADNRRVTVKVVDDGPPIPDEVFQQMQKPFFTTRPEGTGMGLSIARRLTESQSGKLSIRRNSGRGLTAIVSFPGTSTTSRGALQAGQA